MAEKRRQTSPQVPYAFQSSWGESNNSIWLATTLTLHRNIDKFHFPHKLDLSRLESVATLVKNTCEGSSAFDAASFTALHLNECSPSERDYLFEHFLIFEPLKGNGKGCEILFDNHAEVSVCVNFSDHIQLHWLDLSGELEKKFEKLVQLEQYIEKKLSYAYSERFGFLTSDAARSGTGLLLRAYIHVPALIFAESFESSFEEEREEIIDFSGIQGSKDELIGDIAVLFNRWTLGVTEEMIMSSLRTEVAKLESREQVIRKKILQEKDSRVIDKISRALGLAKHSFSIDTTEALKVLSMIKFGVELGWIKGADVIDINRLLLQCRRSHLLEAMSHSSKESLTANQEVIYQLRAQFLRSAAEKLNLDVK